MMNDKQNREVNTMLDRMTEMDKKREAYLNHDLVQEERLQAIEVDHKPVCAVCELRRMLGKRKTSAKAKVFTKLPRSEDKAWGFLCMKHFEDYGSNQDYLVVVALNHGRL
jgi:hypothetical protein